MNEVFNKLLLVIMVSHFFFTSCGGGGGSLFEFDSDCFPFPKSWCGSGSSTYSDKTPPTRPTNLFGEAISPGSIQLNWTRSTDDRGSVGYIIYRDGEIADTYFTNKYTDSGLSPLTEYCYSIVARDPHGNQSDISDTVCIETPGDTQLPTTPYDLILRQVTSHEGQEGNGLYWSQSTDNATLVGYNIYRDGTLIDSVPNYSLSYPRYDDYTINPVTDYCYEVTAYDAGGNETPSSNTICSTASWAVNIIENGTALQYPSIGIDSGNNVHVSYRDSANVYYANNLSGNWLSSVIGTPEDHGHHYGPALTVDAADVVHIAYRNNSGKLIYTNSDAVAWSSEIVDDGYRNAHPSIGTDKNNYIHLAYMQERVVTYTTNKTGEWIATPLMDIGAYGSFSPELVVDNLGFVHISFIDYNNNDLVYATNRLGKWVIEIIDSDGYVGEYSDIAVDASQKAHITYYDTTNRGLKYATSATGSWAAHIIDVLWDSGFESSIAVDESSHLHIAHFQDNYMVYSNNISGDWLKYSIDNYRRGTSNRQPSLAIDTTGRVHLVYQSDGGATIRHATPQ
jgi:hypothetical protein